MSKDNTDATLSHLTLTKWAVSLYKRLQFEYNSLFSELVKNM
jgi:hypothetical protein